MNVNEDLRKWVAEKWVDIGAPKKGGGFKPCGRSKGEKRKGYPKCVPLAKANSMSKSQRRSAVKRKRAVDNDGPKPDLVSTFKRGSKMNMSEKLNICLEKLTLLEASPAWQRSEGKNPEGGLNKKGVASYRAANPGSKLQTAVTTDPSKLKAGSKKAKRRLSFCRRMKGMKSKLTSAKTARDPDSRINKSLRKWNC
jgi:hypothetical protein